MTKRVQLLGAIRQNPGHDDDELSDTTGIRPRQQVNQLARRLVTEGLIRRLHGPKGKLINVPIRVTGDIAVAPRTSTRWPVDHPRGDGGASDQAAAPVAPNDSPSTRRHVGPGFQRVTTIRPDRDADGAIAVYDPAPRYAESATARLHAHGGGPFCRFRVPSGLSVAGVYALVVEDEVMYMGSAEDLARRFNPGYGQISPRNCYEGGQQTNCRINKLVLQQALEGRDVHLWFRPTADPKRLEAELLPRLRPAWNLRKV